MPTSAPLHVERARVRLVLTRRPLRTGISSNVPGWLLCGGISGGNGLEIPVVQSCKPWTSCSRGDSSSRRFPGARFRFCSACTTGGSMVTRALGHGAHRRGTVAIAIPMRGWKRELSQKSPKSRNTPDSRFQAHPDWRAQGRQTPLISPILGKWPSEQRV